MAHAQSNNPLNLVKYRLVIFYAYTGLQQNNWMDNTLLLKWRAKQGLLTNNVVGRQRLDPYKH